MADMRAETRQALAMIERSSDERQQGYQCLFGKTSDDIEVLPKFIAARPARNDSHRFHCPEVSPTAIRSSHRK